MTKDSILHRLPLLPRVESWQRGVPWVNSLFVLLLAYSLAGVSWRLWPLLEQGGDLPLRSLSEEGEGEGKGSLDNLDAIAAMHLFGEVAVVEDRPIAAVVDAPETRLSLTLRGIIALSEGGLGRALIAEGSGEEKPFKVGDSLSGGAILHEVLTDKVILKRGGRFETLTLPRERLNTTSTSAETTPQSTTVRTSAGRQGAIQHQLTALRDQIAKDPQQAFNLLQVQPVMEAGAIKGYRVTPGKQRRLFHGTGLRAGDVVTSVNGIALSDAAQMAALFEQFKSATQFDLKVERGGRPTSLTINLGK